MTPFEGDGVWLRCALHAHTTNSDGEMAPEMLVRHYEWAGFDVLALTDHWVRTVERSTRKLLVIPSVELNAQAPGPDDDAHVLALGVEADPVIPEHEFEPLQEVVSWIDANGGYSTSIQSRSGAACIVSPVKVIVFVAPAAKPLRTTGIPLMTFQLPPLTTGKPNTCGAPPLTLMSK